MLSVKEWLFLSLIGLAIFFLKSPSGVPLLENPVLDFLGQYYWIFMLAIPVLGFFYTRMDIAGWYGAEHMAIAAYEENGVVNIESIAKQNPVNERCGGRLFLPMTAGIIVASFVATQLGISSSFLMLLLF